MNIRVNYTPTSTVAQFPLLLLTHGFGFSRVSSPSQQILVSKFAIRILVLLLAIM